ncbi:MAG TPA: hypothetical protein PLN13_11815 [Bacteroidia bacterium]|nr:hypothetical protein [Bacteroidia bacterium]HRH09261.1 hypothetical protein [Bacteroidia bacterium]
MAQKEITEWQDIDIKKLVPADKFQVLTSGTKYLEYIGRLSKTYIESKEPYQRAGWTIKNDNPKEFKFTIERTYITNDED